MKPLNLAYRPVAGLIPYARNARTHSQAQVAQIAASIREFGWTNPVLVDGQSGIIAGHGRVLAAQLLGMEEVPCIELSHMTEAQKRAYVLADNKLALNAGWDDELLRLELGELRDLGYDLALAGFEKAEVDALLQVSLDGAGNTDPDDAPAAEKVPVSRPGDVWLLGRHRLLCGDSTNLEAVLGMLGDDRVDVVWTDPPYNVAYKTKAGEIANDDLPAAEFLQFLRDAFTTYHAIMKPGAAIYVAHADSEGDPFRVAFREHFKLSGCLIWRKNALVLGRSDYQWIHEPILYGWKEGAAHRWFGGRKQTTVVELGLDSPFVEQPDGRWAVTVGDRVFLVDGDAQVEESSTSIIYADKPARSADHPTMKPVALIERMLRNNAKPGDLVADLFGGSGSTLMAAERLGMSARLVELSQVYCDVIVRRWQEYTGQAARLESTGETFAAVSTPRLAA